MIPSVSSGSIVSDINKTTHPVTHYWKDGRCKIELIAIRQLKLLLDLKREIKNNLSAVSYEQLLNSINSNVYCIKVVTKILGVIKVTQNHERALIEEIKWNIAVCLGDSENFVPTMAWKFRDESEMKGGESFAGRVDAHGRYVVDRGLKEGRCYALEPYIDGKHIPIKNRQEWLKTALMGIVYGIFDGHENNILYDESAKKAYLIDYVQSMPPRNAPLMWGGVLRPFLRLSHMCDAFATDPFTPAEREWICERLQRYKDCLPKLKAYLNSFIVQKKLCYVAKSQFDAQMAVEALEERLDKTKIRVEGRVSNFQELVFKLCPFYQWQAIFIHLDNFSNGFKFDRQKFNGVGNCDLYTIIKNLLNNGISVAEVVDDLENGLPFDEVFTKYKNELKILNPASISDRTDNYYRKYNNLLRSAVFSGADVYEDRNLFHLDYYRLQLRFADIKYEESKSWLYVYYYGGMRAMHPDIISGRIHLIYKQGNLPSMTFEEFKKIPSTHVDYAIHILNYCFEHKIKVIAADKVALIVKWAGLKRGESFVGQIYDKAEFTLFYRKANGKRFQKPIKRTADILVQEELEVKIEPINPFLELDDLKIPYRIEGGKGSILIKNERCPIYNLHKFYVVSIEKGQLRPMTAIQLKTWLKGEMQEFNLLKFLSSLNFCLSDFQQDMPIVDSYLIQQIRDSDTFYFYKKDVSVLKEYRMEIRGDQVHLINLEGEKERYSLEEFKKYINSFK